MSRISAVSELPPLDLLSRDELIGLCRAQKGEIAELRSVTAQLTERIAELEKQTGSSSPPPFVRGSTDFKVVGPAYHV